MQYLKCVISKPGLIESVTLDFDRSPVIIYGKNGSGKTLIAKSLIDVLYRKFSNGGALTREAWDGIYCDILFAMSKNGKYRITSNGNKYYTIQYSDKFGDRVLYSNNSVESAAGKAEPKILAIPEGRAWSEFIELVDLKTYLISSYMPAPSDLTDNESVNYTSLKKIMMNDTSQFYQKYCGRGEHEHDAVLGRKLDEEILTCESLHRNLHKQVQIIDVSQNRIEKLFREKRNVSKEIKDLQTSLSSVTRQKNILLKIIENLSQIESLNRRLEELKRAVMEEEEKRKTISEMKHEIDTRFPHLKELAVDDVPSLEELQEIFNSVKNINEKIENHIFKNSLRKKRIIRTAAGIGIAATIAVLMILLSKWGSLEGYIKLIAGIIVSTCLIIPSLFMYLILGTKKKDFEKLQQEKLDLEKAIKDKIKGNRIDYDGDKAHELFEFLLQYFEDYLEYSEKTRDLQKLKESVREGGYLKEITAELDALKKQEVEIKENIQASIKTVEIVKNVDVDKSEIDSLVHTIDNEIDICRSRISEKEKILLQIDGEIQENHDYSDELEKLMDEKNKYEDRIKLLHSRSSAVNCIKSALEEADRRREQKQLNKLIKNTIEKFNYLTGNQYITKIDERDIQDILNKKSFTKELNPAVIHAIVLSIKFSLTEFIVNAGLTLPLIIDDPFYSMDEERMRRFKDMVDDAAKSRQIIIFTHLKDSKNWGKFIEL